MISMGALIAKDRELSHMRHSSFPAAAHTRFQLQFYAILWIVITTDVTKTGNRERGAGNGEWKSGNELSAEPPQKSKMAVQKRERERRRQRKEFVPWLKSGGDEIANQTPILRLRFEQVVCFFDIQPVSFTI